MKIFDYHTFTTVTTIEETMDHMKELTQELSGTSLENLIAFNQTYYIITKNVYEKLGKGVFTDDERMKRIDIVFGNYYFTALKAYIDGRPCAPSWNMLFDACRADTNYQFIYMALGVNAHVNNDLPQTLLDVMQGDLDDTDYLRINSIIANSLTEVVTSLQEKNKLLNTVENSMLPFYTMFLSSLIKNWRKNAWNCYVKLGEKEYTVADVETISKVVANRLIQTTSLRSFFMQIATFYF